MTPTGPVLVVDEPGRSGAPGGEQAAEREGEYAAAFGSREPPDESALNRRGERLHRIAEFAGRDMSCEDLRQLRLERGADSPLERGH